MDLDAFFLCYKYLKVDLGISGEKSVHFKSVFDYKISILFSFPFYFPNDGAHHNKTTNKKERKHSKCMADLKENKKSQGDYTVQILTGTSRSTVRKGLWLSG